MMIHHHLPKRARLNSLNIQWWSSKKNTLNEDASNDVKLNSRPYIYYTLSIPTELSSQVHEIAHFNLICWTKDQELLSHENSLIKFKYRRKSCQSIRKSDIFISNCYDATCEYMPSVTFSFIQCWNLLNIWYITIFSLKI